MESFKQVPDISAYLPLQQNPSPPKDAVDPVVKMLDTYSNRVKD